MPDINQERSRLLIKICRLYYEDGLNQLDIAKRLGISRPHVSRMLSAAKAEGLVRITISDLFASEHELEREFIETFGIQDAFIVDVPEGEESQRLAYLGRTGASLLESALKDGDRVGVMAGRTVAAVAEELQPFAREDLQLVPLVGGWGAEGARWQANANTMTLADKLKAKYWFLNAPAVVARAETGLLLREEPEIARVLTLAKQCSLAVIGVGDLSEQATMVRAGHVGAADVERMRRAGAAANLCASLIDIEGREIEAPDAVQMLGLTARELRAIPNVLAVAGGPDKVQALTAALRGRWIDIVVTDAGTARDVLRFHRERE